MRKTRIEAQMINNKEEGRSRRTIKATFRKKRESRQEEEEEEEEERENEV